MQIQYLKSLISHHYKTLKTSALLEELTFSTIAEVTFHVKHYTPLTVSRTQPLVGPMHVNARI